MTKNTEDGFIKKLWNKTVFPEMIKRRKEEKQLQKQIEHEARLEAIKESRDIIKEQYKQKAIDKASGKKKDVLQKLADGFKIEGGGLNATDKIGSMLGTNTNNQFNNTNRFNSMLGMEPEEDRPNRIKQKKRKNVKRREYYPRQHKRKNVKRREYYPQQKSAFDFEDKINRMLK